MADEFKIPAVKIFLHKAIPSGAGLGGGSSDAAFMLKLLNNFFSLNVSDKILSQIASEIGSDCAFFIKNKAVIAKGKGDDMKEISLDLKGKHILIVKPDFSISTAKAYSMVTPKPSLFPLINLSSGNIREWRNFLVNDFEEAMNSEFPEIKKIKDTLYDCGAQYAAMSGSGSAVYGIFEKEPRIGTSLENYFTWKGLLE